MPDHLDAIIAASAVLAGVIVSQGISIFSAWLDRKRRRNELLMTKLDELLGGALVCLQWLKDFHNCTSLRHAQSLPSSIPCHQIESLAILYFHHLLPTVRRYTASLRSHYSLAMRSMPDEFPIDPPAVRPLPSNTAPSAPDNPTLGEYVQLSGNTSLLNSLQEIRQIHTEIGAQAEKEAQALLNRS